jgi:hypothetical protein
VALGSTQTLIEINTRSIYLGDKGDRFVGLETFALSCEDFLEILGASTFWSPQGLSRL